MPTPARSNALTRRRLLAALIALVVLLGAWAVAVQQPVPGWELDLTEDINRAPDLVATLLWPVMQLGSLWGPLIVGVFALVAFGPRRGLVVFVSGALAWIIAKEVKSIVERGRPAQYLPGVDVREGKGEGLGFVSGHSAVAFALATALMPALPRWGKVVAALAATLVAVSRIVVGVHLPADVVGGAALGVLVALAVDAAAELVVRARRRPRDSVRSR